MWHHITNAAGNTTNTPRKRVRAAPRPPDASILVSRLSHKRRRAHAADILIACERLAMHTPVRVKVDKPPAPPKLRESRGAWVPKTPGLCNCTYDLLILPVHYRDRHLFFSANAVVRCGFRFGEESDLSARSAHTGARARARRYNSLFMRARAEHDLHARARARPRARTGVVLPSRLCRAAASRARYDLIGGARPALVCA